jgi:hypothetical protein
MQRDRQGFPQIQKKLMSAIQSICDSDLREAFDSAMNAAVQSLDKQLLTPSS